MCGEDSCVCPSTGTITLFYDWGIAHLTESCPVWVMSLFFDRIHGSCDQCQRWDRWGSRVYEKRPLYFPVKRDLYTALSWQVPQAWLLGPWANDCSVDGSFDGIDGCLSTGAANKDIRDRCDIELTKYTFFERIQGSFDWFVTSFVRIDCSFDSLLNRISRLFLTSAASGTDETMSWQNT